MAYTPSVPVKVSDEESDAAAQEEQLATGIVTVFDESTGEIICRAPTCERLNKEQRLIEIEQGKSYL